MATLVRKSSSFIWQGAHRLEKVRQPGFSQRTELADNRRHWRNLHNCELLQECLNADLLDDQHGEYYTTAVEGEDIAHPSLVAGTGITITPNSPNASDITISASNNGDVVGPASSTDHAYARYHLATGKIIQNSQVTEDDAGTMTTRGRKVEVITGNDTTLNVAVTDHLVFADTASNAITVNLPVAVAGMMLVVKNVGGDPPNNAATVTPRSGESIDGVTDGTIALASSDSVMLVCRATGSWQSFAFA